MWNMNFSGPTLIILAIITIAYMSRRRLPLRVNRVFEGLLAASLLTAVMDYVSTIMDSKGAMFSGGLLWLVNYLFFGLFAARSYYLFCFPLVLFDVKQSRSRRHLFRGFFIADEAFILLGSITGWIFSIQNRTYVSGPLYSFINLQFLFWIIGGYVTLVKVRKSSKTRRTAAFAYLTILLVGLLLRAALPNVVIMNLFCMLAILIMYLLYLNPDQYIDDVTLLFNDKGWNRVIEEAASRKDFSIVGFGIRNFAALRETRGIEKLNYALSEIGSWIHHTWPKLSAFYIGRGNFMLTAAKPFDQKAVLDEIALRFSQPWQSRQGEYYLSVNRMVMTPGVHVSSAEQLSSTMNDVYARMDKASPLEIIHLDEEMFNSHRRRNHVQEVLVDALNNNALEMYLQPVINTKTDTVEGAEALCRLKDREGNTIYPDEFMPIAMKNGNMSALGRQMFRKACAFMSREDVGFSNLQWINVNIAPEQFQNPNLLDDYLGILKEYNLEPSLIHLEVTEETMIDRTLLHDSMAKFCAKGFIFDMDDFGSSYSNMIRLQQNNFTTVKIDREFTWSYFNHKTALLPDIVLTCHDLGMTVVTEGVETKEMVDGVKDMGVDYIQGYYYSRPIPWKDFVKKYIKQ